MRSYRGLSSFLYIVYSLFRLAINLVREPIARPAPLPWSENSYLSRVSLL